MTKDFIETFNRLANDEKANTAQGRMEILCELYDEGDEEVREIITELMDDDQRNAFLLVAGAYHLFDDPSYYEYARNCLAIAIYDEMRGE